MCVCVCLRFEGLLLFTYLKFGCVFFFLSPFLILFNFSFQISRPQVVSDKAKADWRKLFIFIFLLLNYSVLLRTLVAALFRRDPVIVVVAFWVEVGCFVDCAVREKVIVY